MRTRRTPLQESDLLPPILTLVVDDDEAILRLVSRKLELSGIPCDTALSAKAALELVRRHRYRVVISDINMPGMTGVELVGEVKEIAPLTQMIMLTADAHIAPAADLIARGACEYISKAEDMSLLVEETKRCFVRAERWFKSFELRRLARANT
ncbi:MAG: response regulator [Planctomycetes bacterium]|nr:response regulator [Planctomycetota bacterium]